MGRFATNMKTSTLATAYTYSKVFCFNHRRALKHCFSFSEPFAKGIEFIIVLVWGLFASLQNVLDWFKL